MNDVDGRAGHFGHGDGTMNGFGFSQCGPREGVIDGRALAFGQGFLHDDIDDAAVFGVHADEGAVLSRLAERFKYSGVVNHEDAGVSHEEFEAGHAFADQGIHVFETGFTKISDDHMQAVIDGRFLIGLFPPDIQGIAHLGAFGLNGEIDKSGGATKGGRFGAGFEIVG